MSLGENMKRLRKDKGLTQKIVADYLGVSVQAYSRYEKDERQPDIESIRKIATFFECTTDYLLDVETGELTIDFLKRLELYYYLKHQYPGLTDDEYLVKANDFIMKDILKVLREE